MSKTNEVAKAIINEVPLSQVKNFIAHAGNSSGGSNAMGDGCGGGCGGGAGCIDPNGHTGLTNAQITTALKDNGLLSAINSQIKTTTI
jgi:hypothetical protein